jgi:hypothetical protein
MLRKAMSRYQIPKQAVRDFRGGFMKTKFIYWARINQSTEGGLTTRFFSRMIFLTVGLIFVLCIHKITEAGEKKTSALHGEEGAHLSTDFQGDKWGFKNEEGEMVIKPIFDHADSFVEDRASVTIGKCSHGDECEEARWTFIDPRGKMIMKPKLCAAWDFKEGLAGVKFTDNGEAKGSCKKGKWGFIDREGRIVIKPKYEAVY